MIVNFRDEILEEAGDEEIIGIVIYPRDEWLVNSDEELPKDKLEVVLPWDLAERLLDYQHDNGYGGQECHDIHAWTKNKVMFVHEYDGSTRVRSVPRNPEYVNQEGG